MKYDRPSHRASLLLQHNGWSLQSGRMHSNQIARLQEGKGADSDGIFLNQKAGVAKKMS